MPYKNFQINFIMSRGCLCLQLQNNLSKNQVKRINRALVQENFKVLEYCSINENHQNDEY